MTIRNTDQQDRHDRAGFDRPDASPPRDECCQSGCTVCVLDYPDGFPAPDAVEKQISPPTPTFNPDEVDQHLLDMLGAFERAEAIVAALDGKEADSIMPNEGDH